MMTLDELIPTIKKLNHNDKIYLLQVIANELAKEEKQKSPLSQFLLFPELGTDEDIFNRVQDIGRAIAL